MAKILFVSGWYPTDDRPSFGIFVRRHAEAAALMNEVTVLYVKLISSPARKIIEVVQRTNNNLPEVIVTINKKKFGFPPLSSLLKFIFYIRAVIQGYKIIASQTGKPDIVHANILYEGGRQALLLKWLYGIPFVCTEHWTGYLPEDGTFHGWFRKYFSKLIASNAKFIIPVTQPLATHMQSHGLNGNYSVIPNVVNTNVFSPASSLSKNRNQLLHISSLDERQKNFNGILNAFKLVLAKIPDLKLVVAGGAENLESAMKLVVEHNLSLDKVIFMGYVGEKEIVNLIRESLCLILFSNYETQGCVVLESIACGTPVIATNLPVLKNVISESNGILVEVNNEIQLAQAIENIYSDNQKYSPDKMHSFIAENFSYEKIGRQLNEVYQRSILAK
jgi:glycosyltransferase involved in cell wall biosynthesis